MIVTAPASSANLGPGFDCLALALDLPFHLAVGGERPDGHHPAEPGHPASVAFAEAGGDPSVPLWWRSPVPPGRGLGFSGAARVAGAYAAARLDGLDHGEARAGAFRVAATLEGHADNAAASAHGGLVVAAGERVIRLDLPPGLVVVAWSPSAATSTDSSRRRLPEQVALADAAFSVARAALWVAAVAVGDLAALREATEDGLHQDHRLAARPDAASVREAFLSRPQVLGAWLSGSGPTVAALVRARDAERVAGDLPEPGAVRTLDVDPVGVRAAGDGPTDVSRPPAGES